MTIAEIRTYIRSNIEDYAGRKATMNGTLLKQKFSINGMLSSTWQQSIPVCTVRGADANSANIAIHFKQIKSITKTRKCFDNISTDLEKQEYYKHTGKDRIVFEIELKTGDRVDLWINPIEEYANTANILAKVAGTYKKV